MITRGVLNLIGALLLIRTWWMAFVWGVGTRPTAPTVLMTSSALFLVIRRLTAIKGVDFGLVDRQ